jgi:pyridoxamine 5'-phosphate oxidase
MEFQDCITFATEHPVCQVATMDRKQPRVRTLLLLGADEKGFAFVTFSPKQLVHQLRRNPRVEVCFYNNAADLADAKQMRVTGEVEFLEDKETLDKAYETRAFLEPIVGRPLRPLTVVFRISSGEAHFWTIPDVLKEPTLERIRF